MVFSKAQTVEAYLDELPPAWRAVVRRLARHVARTAPEGGRSMRFRMPTFDLDGLPWIAIAVQKHGLSFYLVDLDLLEDRRGELEGCNVGRSCVRVRRPEDVPFAVLERLIDDSHSRWRRGAKMAGHELAHTKGAHRACPPGSTPSARPAGRSKKPSARQRKPSVRARKPSLRLAKSRPA